MELLNFSAIALLKPKHAPPDALFDLAYALDLKKTRDLQPAPETVKVAIEGLKKAGIHAQKGTSHALNISGPTSALLTIFGVTLNTIDDANSTAKFAFHEAQDQTSNAPKIVNMPTPVANHPLKGIIVGIYVPSSTELLNHKPRHPQANPQADWGKLEAYHVWPHELRGRLGDPLLVTHPHMKTLGYGVTIALNDSGIDITHPYFAEELEVQNAQFLPGGYSLFEETTKAGKERVSAFKKQYSKFNRLSAVVGQMLLNYKPESERADRHREIMAQLITSLVKDPIFEHWSQEYRKLWPKKKKLMLRAVASKKNQLPNDKKTLKQWAVELKAFRNFVEPKLKYVLDYGNSTRSNSLSDNHGHGTEMAASILGVASNAKILSYATYQKESPGASWWFGNILMDQSFENIEYATAAYENDKNAARIISNSWSHSADISNLTTKAHLAEFSINFNIISRAVGQGIIVLFAAGNAGHPLDPEISLWALTGSEKHGALTVGGAWDKNEKNTNNIPDPQIELSNAAHGIQVQFPGTQDKISIPNICGLVGPVSNNSEAPYVYLPTKKDGWNWKGRGTSSATAQVAGVCATIVAQWPNLSPAQVKQALIEGGLNVTQGTSYQGKTPQQINPNGLKRVHIAGAFAKAKELNPTS